MADGTGRPRAPRTLTATVVDASRPSRQSQRHVGHTGARSNHASMQSWWKQWPPPHGKRTTASSHSKHAMQMAQSTSAAPSDQRICCSAYTSERRWSKELKPYSASELAPAVPKKWETPKKRDVGETPKKRDARAGGGDARRGGGDELAARSRRAAACLAIRGGPEKNFVRNQ